MLDNTFGRFTNHHHHHHNFDVFVSKFNMYVVYSQPNSQPSPKQDHTVDLDNDANCLNHDQYDDDGNGDPLVARRNQR